MNDERRTYSLYVLQQRAIPHVADGLKASARRVLWTGRNGAKYKSATLAGATMPIHPHQSPESTVNTLAAPFGNNIPLLNGDGAFGTLLDPTAYAAARYTSVSISQFTKDVVFRDIEVVPMQENYDGTLEEPKHFLPLVPIALLNPQHGIAVGFASNILPRSLPNIIRSQLNVLTNTASFNEELPEMVPLNQKSVEWFEFSNGYKYTFHGEYEKTGATTVKIINLPYGLTHEKYIELLNKLEDEGTIVEYTDNSRDEYDIDVRLKRGILSSSDHETVLKLLGLVKNVAENMTVINFDGESIWVTEYRDLITKFCEWRLKWYVDRYRRLADLLEIDIQRYKDVLTAISRNVGNVARKIQSRLELKEFLKEIGIVYVDYIADLAVYRFTQEEKEKTEAKLKEANATMKNYQQLLKSKAKRKEVYVTELKQVLADYRKGKYEK